ncbi:EF-P lysine aminoacylase EpmA [Marinobacterium jannaschii]|uniref:EF-P lysine aminoacylase EpmA n=1 Tax=Marinobacterium jannaschii TaxID=64970 RepID=UPI000486D61C|nr:EF-P lysine aminoacylase EpmA [Marinobacterium jannaschii]
MNPTQWQPTASVDNLKRRAEVLAQIRQFFARRGVMEVDTPVMSHCAVSDPFIDTIETAYRPHFQAEAQVLYLQTSPEYAMKRLLAAGSGPIYQMAKAFRNGEYGKRHNPEFTMLEWYRPGFDDQQLMDEVEALVSEVLGDVAISHYSYGELFQHYLGLDPHQADARQLAAVTRQHIEIELDDDDPDTWLNLLMSHVIEPALASRGAVFVHDYPASQAALAKVKTGQDGTEVAARFELFVNGIELANGYHELTDAAEQQARLLKDQRSREQLGLPCRPLEMRLVAALESGMPECAGVALGVDRLVMMALGTSNIRDVLAFPLNRA